MEEPTEEEEEAEADVHGLFHRNERKSPAASFGSRRIGAVVLPFELQRSITRLISESDKPLIHADAQRLFSESEQSEREAEAEWPDRYTPPSWSTRYTPPSYTEPRSNSKISHIKARLNRQRDGTAFASVVMPAQYAVVRAVLEGVKSRLGDEWGTRVDRVVEWGSGTGAGMWAALHTFQRPGSNTEDVETTASVQPGSVSITPEVPPRAISAPNPISFGENTPSEPSPASFTEPTSPPEPLFHHAPNDPDGLRLTHSNIVAYTGIDKRDGLTTIARRLLHDVPLRTSVSIQKSLHPSDRVQRASDVGLGTVAVSAFMLSTLGNASLRREMVREMWESGADVMIIIDDASADGFRHVADAREHLLKLGRREIDAIALERERAASEQSSQETQDTTISQSQTQPEPPPLEQPQTASILDDGRGKRGSHVVAPCPHDHACPLALHQNLTSSARRSTAVQTSAGTVRCTFAQRLQRPAFVRRTKHAGRGEEDVGYAYVVVRRGVRERARGTGKGRVGAVGRWAEEAEAAKAKEAERRVRWVVEEGGEPAAIVEEDDSAAIHAEEEEVEAAPVDGLQNEVDIQAGKEAGGLEVSVLEDLLRDESYSWPRINFPPLKRSGHVLIDACMPEGTIMRMTFPRSQGKQIYYDARKSNWGDLFPHTPKHRPVLRYTGSKPKASRLDPLSNDDDPEGRLDSTDEKMWNRLMGDESRSGDKREKKEKRWVGKVKGDGRGRGGEGALGKEGLVNEKRAGWATVMDGLKVEDRKRRRQRKEGRSAKEVDGY
ncbi:hypothetical protein K439DRAFT_1407953 [Ramaria rubella]|nr:hypothetical protein K439DRAFT_1407953 [Ramaria rubella]